MADREWSPASVCDHCPHDPRLCLADNWSGGLDAAGRPCLRFTCPFIDLRVEPALAGVGPWRLTDLGVNDRGTGRGTVAIADGRMTPPRDAMAAAVETFRRRGWFRAVPDEEVVAAMVRAYREQVPADPILPRVRRVVAEA